MKVIIAGRLSCSPANWAIVCPLRLRVVFGISRNAPRRLGASCLMGAVIDAKTGKVNWWNFSICCWLGDVDDKFQPIEFRLNSKLIVFSGARNEKGGDVGAHFY